jgi:hypothetical protein
MNFVIKLNDDLLSDMAISYLERYKITNHLRSPSVGVLFALLYYNKKGTLPLIEDLQDGVTKKELEYFADSIFKKIDARNENIRMIFTGSWKQDSSVLNNWRQPIDAQTGFRCDAPLGELSSFEFLLAERIICSHRDQFSRKCNISQASCHNPTKKGGSGPTDIPSLPKLLTRVNGKYKIVTLSPIIIGKVLGRSLNRIPLFPFLYALYYHSDLFHDPREITYESFIDEFGLDEELLNSLFDLDPTAPENSQFIQILQDHDLIEFDIEEWNVLTTPYYRIQKLIDKILDIEIVFNDETFIITKNLEGYLKKTQDEYYNFTIPELTKLLLTPFDELLDEEIKLFAFFSQSEIIQELLRIEPRDILSIKINVDGELIDATIDTIEEILTEKIDDEFKRAIDRGQTKIDFPIVGTGETEGKGIRNFRIGQKVFSDRIKQVYRKKCCVCGLDIEGFLIASHIIPWRERMDTRLDLRNGLCLCALHDKAFDLGHISLKFEPGSGRYQLLKSDKLKQMLHENESYIPLFPDFVDLDLEEDMYLPNPEYLRRHNKTFFVEDV